MATKTITVREEAYERLQAMKRDDESFSDPLLRLTNAEEDVMAGFGALAGEGFADAVGEAREQLDEDFEDRTDEPLGQ
ncbi:hypothetical protein BRC81_13220 [Halobacteriales archaeon QS_1_68_20]|nr:MAG: hypothetical protein BRC81_13220 [Halobacteriales archaeon QS_1_68_20]